MATICRIRLARLEPRLDMQAQTNLFLGDACYTIDIPRDKISVTTILEDIAVVTSDMETDVLEIQPEKNGFSIHLQGGGFSNFRIYAPYPVASQDTVFTIDKDCILITTELCGEKYLHFNRV